MLMNPWAGQAALAGLLAGLGALLLAFVALELLGAAAERLWLRHSPGAARQARVRALLAAYRERYAAQAAGKSTRNRQ